MSKLAGIDFGTHCYVGTLPCGCGAALVREMPDFKRETANSVAEMIADGLNVTRLPHEAACDLLDARCAVYPHTNWQRTLEASRQA